QPSTALARLSGSVTSPATGSIPAGRIAAARRGSRTSARTCSPRSSSAVATAQPTFPVAPVTSTRMGSILCAGRSPVSVRVLAVALRLRSVGFAHPGEHLSRKLRAVARVRRGGDDAEDHVVAVELLDLDVGRVAQGHRRGALDHLLD